MEVMEAISTRRSIRKYLKDPVREEAIETVIGAAMSAPSAGNEQPWHFVVIDRREDLDQIPSFHPHSLMLREAPVAILTCGDLSLEKHTGYWTQDCAAATQNMLLAAHSLGLGAVWVGVYPREERIRGLRELLHIPDMVVPFSLVPLGYPAEEKPRAERFNPQRIHRSKW